MGELPEQYKGYLFFMFDRGVGTLYATYNNPFNIVRKLWREETSQAEFSDTCVDAATWLYNQIENVKELPDSNKCMEEALKGERDLNDLSLTYLGEMAGQIPDTIVGYADDAAQLYTLLFPSVSASGCERVFSNTNAVEATVFKRANRL